jgi:hypothetical protein
VLADLVRFQGGRPAADNVGGLALQPAGVEAAGDQRGDALQRGLGGDQW